MRRLTCSTDAATGVAGTPKAIADWMASQPGLRVADRHAATVGGLTGIELDVRLTAGWTKGCLVSGIPKPVVPLVVAHRPQSSTMR